MTYVIGAIAGLLLGAIVGYLKNLLIWRKYLQKAKSKAGHNEAGDVYGRAMISFFINILTLVVAFLLRNLFPFDGIAFLVGTALALAITNQGMAIQQKKAQGKTGGED